jgi:hypothetical protein
MKLEAPSCNASSGVPAPVKRLEASSGVSGDLSPAPYALREW